MSSPLRISTLRAQRVAEAVATGVAFSCAFNLFKVSDDIRPLDSEAIVLRLMLLNNG